MAKATIEVSDVTKRFGDFTAVADVELRVDSGEVVCLLGPSGCGKSTLMRIVAGLEEPTSGTVRLGGEDVTFKAPERRQVGMVFQNPVVYPKMTVLENVMLPIRPGWFRAAQSRQARETALRAIELVGLADFAHRRVEEVGTTVQQRTSVAREIARETGVLVFDEPLTNVGVNERAEFEQSIRQLVKESRTAAIYVTHDQTEAMTLGDRIAVMSEGRIIQDASPDTVYSEPATNFVAWFIGNPGMNMLDIAAPGANGSKAAGAAHLPELLHGFDFPAQAVSVGFRAEDVEIRDQPGPGFAGVQVMRSAVTVGGQRLLTLSAGEFTFKVKAHRDVVRRLDKEAWVRVDPTVVSYFGAGGVRLAAA